MDFIWRLQDGFIHMSGALAGNFGKLDPSGPVDQHISICLVQHGWFKEVRHLTWWPKAVREFKTP